MPASVNSVAGAKEQPNINQSLQIVLTHSKNETNDAKCMSKQSRNKFFQNKQNDAKRWWGTWGGTGYGGGGVHGGLEE